MSQNWLKTWLKLQLAQYEPEMARLEPKLSSGFYCATQVFFCCPKKLSIQVSPKGKPVDCGRRGGRPKAKAYNSESDLNRSLDGLQHRSRDDLFLGNFDFKINIPWPVFSLVSCPHIYFPKTMLFKNIQR
jgi:hypothetical protein